MKSNTLASQISDLMLGAWSFTAPATLYFALYTAAPTEFGGGTEVSGGSYARVSVDNDLVTWDMAVDGAKTLAIDVEFPSATGAWGTVVAWGLHTQASGDHLYMYGPLSASLAVAPGDTATFAAGSIIVEEE